MTLFHSLILTFAEPLFSIVFGFISLFNPDTLAECWFAKAFLNSPPSTTATGNVISFMGPVLIWAGISSFFINYWIADKSVVANYQKLVILLDLLQLYTTTINADALFGGIGSQEFYTQIFMICFFCFTRIHFIYKYNNAKSSKKH